MGFKDAAHLDRWAHDVESQIGELKGNAWAAKHGIANNDRGLDELGSYLKAQVAGAVRPEHRGFVLEGLDRSKAEKARETITKADLGTPLYSDATTGSYLVPVEYLAEVQRIADLESVFKPRVRTVPMGSRTMTIPKESTTLSLTWVGTQSSANTEVLPTFSTDTLTAYNLTGWIGITESLAEDSAISLGQYFSEVWGQKYGLAIDNAILNGTGTPTTGLFQGASGIDTVTMGAGDTSYVDIESDDLLDMISELNGAERRGSIYVMNPVVFDVVRGLKDANGRYIVDMTQGPIPSIFGYPVQLCDSAPANASDNEAFVFFGNPRHIVLGMRKDLEIKFYGDTSYNVEYDQVFWRARARIGIAFPRPEALVVLKTAAS